MTSTLHATLRWLAISGVGVAMAAATSMTARAAAGLTELPPAGNDGPIAVFYPTQAAEQAVVRGPFTLQAAPNALPTRGNGRLIVVSHGSGSAPWMYVDLARHLVVAGVPFAADFDPATLAQPVTALGLIQAQQDRWLLPRFHSGPILAACTRCELLADLPQAGHGALLSPLPPDMPAWLARLLNDPPGFQRAQDVALVFERTAAFFRKHLLAEIPKP